MTSNNQCSDVKKAISTKITPVQARQPRILRLPDVKAKTGIGRSTIYALMASGDFPRSIRIGARAVGWLESDIDRWIESRHTGSAYEPR